MKLLKSKKTITLIIALLTVIFSLTAFLTVIASPVGHADAATTVSAPTLNIVQYNCAVAFNWTVGQGGDELYYAGMNGQYFTSIGSATYSEIAFPSALNTKSCDPTKKYWKSYSTSTNTFSDSRSSYTQIDHGDHIQTTFARDCRYTIKGNFKHWQWGVGTNLPTDYGNNSMLKWAHGGKNKNIVKATVAYKGYIGDFQIKIPVLGYQWAGITIGPYEFQMRTGPKYLYFRAVSGGIVGSAVSFAFAVV